MQLIDTHAHLDTFAESGTLDLVLQNAKSANLKAIICCSAWRKDWKLYERLSAENLGFIRWQMGLHPTEVSEGDFEYLREMPKFINGENPPLAIGEIGLDYYKFEGTPAQFEAMQALQKKFFKAQLEIAKDAGLPVSIHARDAVRESMDLIAEVGFDFKRVVFHCFSGNLEEVKELNSLGGRASFTGIITFKNAALMREVMLSQGLDKLMLETDCPYLAPTPFRGKGNEPSYIVYTAKKAAELFNISEEKLGEITTKNASEFFKL